MLSRDDDRYAMLRVIGAIRRLPMVLQECEFARVDRDVASAHSDRQQSRSCNEGFLQLKEVLNRDHEDRRAPNMYLDQLGIRIV